MTQTTQALARVEAPASLKKIEFEQRDKAIMRATVAAEITDERQFAAFIEFCQHSNLNPLRREVYGFTDKRNKDKLVVIVGIDGWLKMAASTGLYEGYELEYCGDDMQWKDGWLRKWGTPAACRAHIYRKGNPRPLTFTADFDEFYVDYNPNWKSKPVHMLGLRALAHGLRRAFPDAFASVPKDVELEAEDAEMIQARVQEAPQPVLPDVQPAAAPTRRYTEPPAEQQEPEVIDATPATPPPAATGERRLTVKPRNTAFDTYRQVGGDLADKNMLLVHFGQALDEDLAELPDKEDPRWAKFNAALLAHNCLPGEPGWKLAGQPEDAPAPGSGRLL